MTVGQHAVDIGRKVRIMSGPHEGRRMTISRHLHSLRLYVDGSPNLIACYRIDRCGDQGVAWYEGMEGEQYE